YPEVQRSLDSPAGKNRFTLEPTGQAVQGHSARGACLAKVIFGSHFFLHAFNAGNAITWVVIKSVFETASNHP
ncbi:hypothetical protein N8778_00560, partial [Verrucomicrobia bacterium]|nr:hypothetical protein [Verrucomicrobiota bacterium]